MSAVLTTSSGNGDGSLWIVILAILVIGPIVVGLLWRLADRWRER